MTPAERLLARLERVKATGASRWMARCPAHEDRNPSLSICETDDGRVLVHCFAGVPPSAAAGRQRALTRRRDGGA